MAVAFPSALLVHHNCSFVDASDEAAAVRQAGNDEDTRISFVYFCQASVHTFRTFGTTVTAAREAGTYFHDDAVSSVFKHPDDA